ncbi:hypothetical protein ACP70R_016696 [Stipagrostis hirtigluma subsp. patula]
MAALALRVSSWCPPAAVVAPAPRSARPIPPGRRVLSPAPVSIQARPHDAFRCDCHKRADQHPEPERDDPDVVEAPGSEDGGSLLARNLLRFEEALDAALGKCDAPDMFLKEKDEISSYIMNISSSRADTLNVNNKVMALTVCAEVHAALDLASKVIDIADIAAIGLTAEISQDTIHQMIRTYATIFCNVAEDAYQSRIKMDTVLSFLDALRGLGAICHILVQDTVTKIDDGPFKDNIASHVVTYSHEFDKTMSNLKDEFMMATEMKHTTFINSDGYTL